MRERQCFRKLSGIREFENVEFLERGMRKGVPETTVGGKVGWLIFVSKLFFTIQSFVLK